MNREINDNVKRVTRDLNRRVSRMTEHVIDRHQIQAFVKDYPLLSLAAVIATGYAMGRLISKL